MKKRHKQLQIRIFNPRCSPLANRSADSLVARWVLVLDWIANISLKLGCLILFYCPLKDTFGFLHFWHKVLAVKKDQMIKYLIFIEIVFLSCQLRVSKFEWGFEPLQDTKKKTDAWKNKCTDIFFHCLFNCHYELWLWLLSNSWKDFKMPTSKFWIGHCMWCGSLCIKSK